MSVLWFKRKVRFKEIALEILEQKRLRSESQVRRTNTYASARPRINRLIHYFGKNALSEIREANWAAYVVERLRERPESKFFDDRKCMRQIMLEAHRRGLTPLTPKLKIPDLPTMIGKEITPKEIRRLLLHACKVLRFQIDIGYLMGLRLREMLYLRWDQINWRRQTIKLLASDTKTKRGREIPINPDLLSMFRRLYMQRKSRFVFPRVTDINRPSHHNRWAWKICKQKAGVSGRWHDLRHSCATVMLRKGNSIQAVKTYLGMSAKVLTEIYQHLTVDDLRPVAQSMSRRRK